MSEPTPHSTKADMPLLGGRGPAARLLYLCVGYAALAAGAVGLFLPLMPTTVFLLVAAWSFARSNPALAARIEAHPRFGPALTAWRQEGAISASSKAAACAALALSFVLSTLTVTDMRLLAALAVVLGCIAAFLVTRPAPKPRQARHPVRKERPSKPLP